MQPQLPPDFLTIFNDVLERLAKAEKALTNDAVTVGTGILWPAGAGLLPYNYRLADGAALDRIGFASLFAVYGTSFGVGDGATTFNLPTWIVSEQTNSNEDVSYVEFTANVTVNGTSGAPNTVVTASAFTPNGTDAYWIEFYCAGCQSGSADTVVIDLYDGGTRVGFMAQQTSNAAAAASDEMPLLLRRKIVPTNASHTYSIRAWRTTNNGILVASNGASGNAMPGYISITAADNHLTANDIPVAIKVL